MIDEEMVDLIVILAILGGAALLVLSRKKERVVDEELKRMEAREKLRAIATKRPRTHAPTLPSDMFTISITGTFRVDSAFATMPMRGLARIDPPPMGRETEWQTMPYSKTVPRGDHLIQVMSPYRGRTFIHYLILPAPPGPIHTSNPLTLYINENKSITAEFT